MEINIILNTEEIRTAVIDYLKKEHGIVQSQMGEIKYLDTGVSLNQSIICYSIDEITEAINVKF